jgi:glutamate synthase domain-containing protein 1
MCGITGLLARSADGAVVPTLVAMLQALGRRGPDSTGMSLYGPPLDGDLRVTVWAGDAGGESCRAAVLEAVERFATLRSEHYCDGYFRIGAVAEEDSTDAVAKLTDAIDNCVPGVLVFSVGRSLELLKHTHGARSLYERFELAGATYTHAIGHTRMATESRVDVAHAHPFWARPFPDVTVVHNGHLTNYHKSRRIFEMRGYRFETDNDTEFLAIYLAEKLSRGATLEEAVHSSIDDLDGSFSYLVSTRDGFGVARDRFGTKPCVIAETDEWVAVASEELALYEAFGDTSSIAATELPAGHARAWTR